MGLDGGEEGGDAGGDREVREEGEVPAGEEGVGSVAGGEGDGIVGLGEVGG